MVTRGLPQEWRTNPFVRVAGEHAPVAEVVRAAQARGDLPVEVAVGGDPGQADYAAIDLTLAVAGLQQEGEAPAPAAGLGYSGFSAAQRGAYLRWLAQPTAPAPPAYQQLFLANVEVALLEEGVPARAARAELLRLGAAPAWERHRALGRTVVLACWLAADGTGLAGWFASQSQLHAEVAALALGCQALLRTPLDASQVPGLLAAWELAPPALAPAVLALRLGSQANALGQEVLEYALAQLGDGAHLPLPFRCQHRDLRLALPQPVLRPVVQPLLADMLAGEVVPPAVEEAEPLTGEPSGPGPASLIVEFGHSRSELFAYALRMAQKQAGFQQLMDEDRHMVYRAPFRRSEMRRFWQLWECVQNWSSTRIYVEGRELEKWQVYPYSQYLR